MSDFCVGYHYTSLDSWLQIKEKGLVPYSMLNPRIRELLPKEDIDLKGIFVFQRYKPGEIAHYGQLLWTMIHKRVLRVGLLRVRYPYEDRYNWGTNLGYAYGSHQGSLSTNYGPNWEYHKDEPFDLVTKPIPPSQIDFIASYDFESFVDQQDSRYELYTYYK